MTPDKERAPRGEAVEKVYSQLRVDILEAHRLPGDVLDEGEIAALLGTSRQPVREAIIRLVGEGLAQAIKNRGAIVARLDIGSLPGLFDAQMLLFRMTARLAAQNGGDVSAERLAKIQSLHDAAIKSGDADGIIRLNRQFHLEIAEIGGNTWYRDWLRNVLDHGQRVMRLYVRIHHEKVPPSLITCHHRLIEAIRTRNVKEAEKAAMEDALIVRESISKQLLDSQDGRYTL